MRQIFTVAIVIAFAGCNSVPEGDQAAPGKKGEATVSPTAVRADTTSNIAGKADTTGMSKPSSNSMGDTNMKKINTHKKSGNADSSNSQK